MRLWYILDGHTPVLARDLFEWSNWFETADRHVGKTQVGGILVSTVFLGLDHNFSREGPPVLFETMAFNTDGSMSCLRYCTWDEAVAGHAEVVQQARDMIATAELAGSDLLAELMVRVRQ